MAPVHDRAETRTNPHDKGVDMTNSTRDPIARYIIVNEWSNRIVASVPGNHHMLERICERLDERHGFHYFYDDAEAKGLYQPQIGPNIAVSLSTPWKH